MPVAAKVTEKVQIPDKTQLILKDNLITVKGPLGTVSRVFHHPRITVQKENNSIVFSCTLPKRKEKALVGTFTAHLNNMIKGVTTGFEYKMKIVYSHFPLKATVKGSKFIIENFLGEKSPRSVELVGDTKVTVKGDQVILTGINLEEVSQSAANIERATRIKNFDPRVFQDGIYIVQKG